MNALLTKVRKTIFETTFAHYYVLFSKKFIETVKHYSPYHQSS